MAKKTQKRPSRHERDQAGCIWSLMSIFDFRNGRSTKRLLSDRRRVSKQGIGVGNSSNHVVIQGPTEKCENVADDDESKMPLVDNARTSVKELMEEEMSNEQSPMNQLNDSDLDQTDSKYGLHMKKNQKRKNRICNKSNNDMDFTELDPLKFLMPENFHKVLEQEPSDNLDLQTIIEELAHINQSGEAVTIGEEKLVAAVKLLIEQRVSKSKHFVEEEKNSEELMDALQTLSTNRHLFLKLVQDPNSVLAKDIQNLDQTSISLSGSDLSEEKLVDIKSDEFCNRKNRNFFRRRSKSMDSYYPVERNRDCQSSSKIVILKPGPGPSLVNERNPSHFSFTEIKRKLRHAMGKERQTISPDGLILKVTSKQQNDKNGEKCASGESFNWSSPNRNHFYSERFTKSFTSFRKGEQIGKSQDDSSEILNKNGQCQRLGVSNIYIEAKKHLSEILNNGDEKQELRIEHVPKSLGRILSFSEYNSSPCYSPRKYGEDDVFITAQMRLSPRGMVKNNVSGFLQENHNNLPSPSGQNLESQPRISCGNSDEKLQSPSENVIIPLTNDQECSLGSTEDSIIIDVQSSSLRFVEFEETTESKTQEEENIVNISPDKSYSNSITGDNIQKEEISSQCSKDSTPCIKIDLLGEDQILCSTSSNEVENFECAIDKMERPSPISVLEPLFPDDDISPAIASNISQPVEKEIQPRHIQFEEQQSSSIDQEICVRISLEDEESEFEYIEAVLLGSGLNWDEFLLKWLSLCEILDSSVFEEVESFSGRSRHNQKFLFDCANKALKEVCESYFGCFTGISQFKPNIQPVPKGMDLIHEVWRRVESHLFEDLVPLPLDQLLKRDLENSGKFMNLQSDIEIIGFEMGKSIFDELVDDTLLSFIALPSEIEVIEDANV
ncbi:hypothetical protein ACJIZ3_018470 [Penstemon smallii]|uniref:DUF4378 domain-containing protein n=1 Tax=Penstemon smallii TaxID=265156 RepID=A0ABD3SZT5_9LAMI